VIGGLTRGDFRITDGGREAREILYFGQEEVALDVILLLDASLSMRPVLEKVAASAEAALGELRPGDRAAVMVFDAGVVQEFTDDFSQVSAAIRATLNRTSSSAIQKAVDEAARYFLQQPRTGRRRAVLAITDNRGNSRNGSALPDLWEADAVLAGVVISNPANVVIFSIVQPQSLFLGGIGDIAEKTGGDLLKSDDPGEGLRQMIQRLRARYRRSARDFASALRAGDRTVRRIGSVGEGRICATVCTHDV
jgi:Mg-chelatase subunit ChlD